MIIKWKNPVLIYFLNSCHIEIDLCFTRIVQIIILTQLKYSIESDKYVCVCI